MLCGALGWRHLDLCRGCLTDLPGLAPCCGRCALPLPAHVPDGLHCGACQRRAPPYDQAVAVFRYEGAVRWLIHEFKFRHRLALGRLLGHLLADTARWQAAASLPDLLLPVPLHPARLRERGYNQALEVARVAASQLGIGIDPNGIERVVATVPQLSLARAQRLVNVRGAFRLRRVPHGARDPRLAGRHLAIVDDVVTTGATVGELARLLRRAGAARVDVWAIARTP